jgi:transcriptional regulator with XRE-family HTH domain
MKELETTTIAELLKRMYRNSFLRYEDISDRTGIPVSTMQQWMYNKREPTFTKFVKMIEAMGYTVKLERIDPDDL